MISIIFWMLAAIFNSIMDTITHHYDRSVFNNDVINNEFCDPEISWMNKYVDREVGLGHVQSTFLGVTFDTPEMFLDLWHLCKSMMIFCLLISIMTFGFNYVNIAWYIYPIVFICYGTVWNCVFSIFYDNLLLKTKKQ